MYRHRSIGKRIRMDEPPPMEYSTLVSPSPMEEDAVSPPSSPQTAHSYDTGTNDGYDNMEAGDEVGGEEAPLDESGSFEEPPAPVPEPPPPTPPVPMATPEPLPSMDLGTRRVTRSYIRGYHNPPPISSPPIKRTYSEERTTRRGRPARRGLARFGDLNSSLYDTITKNVKIPVTAVVDNWIESYKTNRDTALLSLMQFFINASGCKGKITEDMTAVMDQAAIIRKMTEEFDEESGEYPLVMSGQAWKKFRVNFCDFIAHLVKQCQNSIIYDLYMMDVIISLLTGLSDSQVRAFRHTATLAAMKLMTALVDVALAVSINLDNTQRQYASERQKTRDKRASDRLENLLTKRQELEENMDEIKNMLTYLFKSVFVHRYRDTLPEIRAICMEEMGYWMKKLPQNFLDDSYLKYIGWTLHDKVGEVRLKCLQALQPLYATDELKAKLELFTSKFKDRIVAMTLDRECEVAVQAVRLVVSILKNHRDVLSDKDCEQVYELVYSSNRALARAAGEFLNERLFVPEEVVTVQRSKRGKKRLPNTPLIRDLVQFFIESELHEHGAYLVDSLIDSNSMMKDWECMTDLLIEEPGPDEEPLDDRQETSLIEIMVCCVKQSATGEAPVGRCPNRKPAPTVKEIKQAKDDRSKMTEHFLQVLPLLLDKYQADSEKLTNLLSVPQHFELEVYSTTRQEAKLDLLLKKMHIITEKHHDFDMLETCAKTLEYLCTEGYAIYTRCDIHRCTLIDSVVNKYKEAIDDWNSLIEGAETPDEDEIYNLINTLKKVSIFYSCHNLGNWNLWDTLVKDVEDAKNGVTTLPEEAIKYCISSCYFAVLWDMHYIEDLIENAAPIEDLVVKLKGHQLHLMDIMKGMVVQKLNQMYSEEAYLVICDLLIVFCTQLHSNGALSSLVYEPTPDLHRMLNSFIQNNVFAYEEDEGLDEHSKIAELHKRRNFLASYCKLIVYNILPSSCASDLFKHYAKCYDDYGDIIKTTVAKTQGVNKLVSEKILVSSRKSLYRDY